MEEKKLIERLKEKLKEKEDELVKCLVSPFDLIQIALDSEFVSLDESYGYESYIDECRDCVKSVLNLPDEVADKIDCTIEATKVSMFSSDNEGIFEATFRIDYDGGMKWHTIHEIRVELDVHVNVVKCGKKCPYEEKPPSFKGHDEGFQKLIKELEL